jgi:predicted transcriptional regulator
MILEKGHNKKQKQCSVIINEALHSKIRHLAYQNKSNNKEIIRRAIALYEKATLFDHLVK